MSNQCSGPTKPGHLRATEHPARQVVRDADRATPVAEPEKPLAGGIADEQALGVCGMCGVRLHV